MNHHDGSNAGRSVAQRAYEHVRSQIVRGRLKPGTRLVTRKLADEIGASLNPVREALGRLASENVIEHIPGAGAFVRVPDRQELIDLYGVREAIEPYAAMRAARLLSRAELIELESICDDELEIARTIRSRGLTHAEDDLLDRWVENDEHFHEILIHAARNSFLSKIAGDMRLLSRIFARHRRLHGAVTLRVAARTWLGHRRLLRCFRHGDGASAAALIQRQIQMGQENVLRQLRRERRGQ
jgi:DNA-binding GntR family transcriptional regulator